MDGKVSQRYSGTDHLPPNYIPFGNSGGKNNPKQFHVWHVIPLYHFRGRCRILLEPFQNFRKTQFVTCGHTSNGGYPIIGARCDGIRSSLLVYLRRTQDRKSTRLNSSHVKI